MKKSTKVKNRQQFRLEGITINKALMDKFLSKEKTKKINIIDDLSELTSKSQSELYEIISQMMQNKTFFKYCYSLLININPGPEYVYDYLNLKEWLNEQNEIKTENNENIKDEKKPHLYSFMKYVYDTMIVENKNQVVSILGPLGSGKTFNLIHIMEYFTTLYSPEFCAMDNFDLVHKSIQFIHILSSTFREYNLESSSCGLLLSLGFNEKNMICSFDIDAQILDFTLPYNENGRTFSILYALIRGANENLKRKCKIPVNDDNLFNLKTRKKNFFVNDKKKEKLELNDLEIFNRFYSLLNYFKFTQGEIIDIINCLAFILNLSDLMIVQTKGGKFNNVNYFAIQIGITTKKLAKNLGIFDPKNIEIFEQKLSEAKFKTMDEMDIFIQGLIKQTYYIVFQYILDKVRMFISDYFTNLNNNNNIKSNRKQKEPKYIYFIDFPGEVEERTLGGFTINIANECLNMYSASAYYEIVEKMLLENVLLKRFKPLKSYTILSNCFNKGGILDHFSNKLNLNNFEQMKENILANQNIYQCYKFPDIKKQNETDYTYYCSFSNRTIKYNYDFLHKEAKSLIYNQNINEILSFASNIIIAQMHKQFQSQLQSFKSFYNYYCHCLQKFFTPIKNYKPFVVYCLHSYDSHKYFFYAQDDNNKILNINEKDSEMYINIVKHSMIPVILNWNWYGYKEWIKINDFIKQFGKTFENVKNRIVYINKFNSTKDNTNENNVDFTKLDNKDKAKCILEVLSKPNDYIIGDEYILMKHGTLKKITMFLNSMIDTAEELSKNLIKTINSNNNSSRMSFTKKNNITTEHSEKRKSKVKDENIVSSNSNISKPKKKSLKLDKYPLPKKMNLKNIENNLYKDKPEKRRNLLKEQCCLNIIGLDKDNLKLLNTEEKNKILESKHLNINHILNKNKEEKIKTESEKLEELINYQDEKTKKNIPSINNTIISDPIFFNKVRNLFDISKSKNAKLFDYSENIDLIIRIQTFYRSLLAKRKFKILKYVTHKIIQIQKFIKGMDIRRKFGFFLKCSKSVLLLQKVYKSRYKMMNIKAKKIQQYYRQKKAEKVERDKLILKKKLEIQKEKYKYLDVDKIMKKVLKNKDDKDIHDMALNLGDEINEINKRKKNEKIIVDVTNNLINEQNPENIVDLLLYSQLPGETKPNRKQIKRSKSDIFRIEDRLIYEGKLQKQKREKLEKLKEIENSKIPEYIPRISKKNEMIMKKYPDNFLKRVEYFKLFKKRNLENLRNQNFMDISSELRFEPKINNNIYNDIQSKYFNIYNNVEQHKENDINSNKSMKNQKNTNLSFKEKNEELTWQDNLRGNDNIINSYKIDKDIPNNLKSLNNKEIKEKGKICLNQTGKEIWPKNMSHRYLGNNYENSKVDE